MIDIIQEHGRLYRNFDRCMDAIEDIIQIAARYNNIEIGDRIARLLNEIEPDPMSEIS